MRLLIVLSLLSVAFAGCLSDDDPGTGPTTDPCQEEMPDREFEPVVNFRVNFFKMNPGEDVELTWDVTDLHDYPFPLSFIDWNLTYSGSPNPVAEGDGDALPGSFGRTLYKEAFHVFTFHISDGQGFEETRRIIVKVGNPLVEIPDVDDVVPQDLLTLTTNLATSEGCYLCVDSELAVDPPLGALACGGYVQSTPGIDCAWIPVSENSWGEEFTVVTQIVDPTGYVTGPGQPDVQFTSSCSGDTMFDVVGDNLYRGADGTGITATIPDGAGCMVVFEFNWPTAASGEGGGTPFYTFTWNERPGPDDGFFMRLYQWAPAEPTAVNLGGTPGEICPGLTNGFNGLGCVWIPISPNQWGNAFDILQSSAYVPGVGGFTDVGDPDAFALAECTGDAQIVEVIATDFTNFGESSTIPAGTGCLMTFNYLEASSMASFTIHGA